MAPSSLVSESEQEYPSPFLRLGRPKSRRNPTKKAPSSDFESSYAANIAPRYLTHGRRQHGVHTPKTTRIPAPVPPAVGESQQSSRRPSPDKKFNKHKHLGHRFQRPSSPPLDTPPLSTKPGRSKLGKGKEKATPRLPPNVGSKSTFRRPASTNSGKVTSMAKHYEKLGRDAKRAESRYSVIRGRRARPVASSRARVQILDSLKDAIEDESESSSSSSEADDEGDDNDEAPAASGPSAPPSPSMAPAPDPQSVTPSTDPPEDKVQNDAMPPPPKPPVFHPQQTPPSDISLPPSPSIIGVRPPIMSLPSPSELDLGGSEQGRHSILKAISGLWLQPAPAARQPIEMIEDPLDDPEHIFRDSSMVVRTDEPTSIIALALKSANISLSLPHMHLLIII